MACGLCPPLPISPAALSRPWHSRHTTASQTHQIFSSLKTFCTCCSLCLQCSPSSMWKVGPQALSQEWERPSLRRHCHSRSRLLQPDHCSSMPWLQYACSVFLAFSFRHLFQSRNLSPTRAQTFSVFIAVSTVPKIVPGMSSLNKSCRVTDSSLVPGRSSKYSWAYPDIL